MIDERYIVEFGADFRVFEFDSKGPKGKVGKIIQYTEINLKNYFNLGFGDKNNRNTWRKFTKGVEYDAFLVKRSKQ